MNKKLSPTTWLGSRAIGFTTQKTTLAALIVRLQATHKMIQERLASATDTPANRDKLSHIIGIERWSQRRLRIALGQPFIEEEYDNYRPGRDVTWEDLKTQFDATRQVTLDLAVQLEKTGLADNRLIKHNQFGGLTLRGWLYYINMHAEAESQRIR